MASLSLRHVRKVYPARHKTKKKGAKVARVNDDFVAVKDFSMEIEDGEFIVFVGPSGCGKSTTLRMIAGLEDISSGELYIDNRLVNNVEPRDRDIAMVFQSYALYPHMTAYDNIAFGLRMRKVPDVKRDEKGGEVIAIDTAKLKAIAKDIKQCERDIAKAEKFAEKDVTAHIKGLNAQAGRETDEEAKKALLDRIAAIDVAGDIARRAEQIKAGAEERRAQLEKDKEYYSTTPVKLRISRHNTAAEIDAKVQWAAKILGITELLHSKPSEMSGGQRQRIALGRAMVRGPKVFLLDEPLSNLDAKLRTAMRSEIVKLHNELKTTFIYVTHDQVEAMTMGTRIVVMKDGYVQQIDTPTNLFDYPENKFVASFIGTPQMNFFEVTVKREGDSLAVAFADGQTLKFDLARIRTLRADILDGQSHKVIMGARGESINIADDGLAVSVNIKEVLGDNTHVFVRHAGVEYIVCLSERADYKPGDTVKLVFNPSKLHFFDPETEAALLGRGFENPVSKPAKAEKAEPVAAEEPVAEEPAAADEPVKKPAKKPAAKKAAKPAAEKPAKPAAKKKTKGE